MAYFSQVDGLGMEALEMSAPWTLGFSNACAHRIWRLSCFTHFPRCAPLALQEDEVGQKKKKTTSEVSTMEWGTAYVRPCRTTCEDYKDACEVKCCDESAHCLFERPEVAGLERGEAGKTQLVRGYVLC